MAALFGLLLGKYLVYAAFLLLTARLLGVASANRQLFALKWSAIRLAAGVVGVGLVFALAYVFEAAGLPGDAVFYASLYGTRALIWAALAMAITGKREEQRRWALFTALGLGLNLAIDLGARAAGLDELKFVC